MPGLVQHELGHQRGEFALARDADLGEHALEHGARGLLGDAELLGRLARRQARADEGGDARLAQREAQEIADQRRIGRQPTSGSISSTIARACVRNCWARRRPIGGTCLSRARIASRERSSEAAIESAV
jgi:hypothetical protein